MTKYILPYSSKLFLCNLFFAFLTERLVFGSIFNWNHDHSQARFSWGNNRKTSKFTGRQKMVWNDSSSHGNNAIAPRINVNIKPYECFEAREIRWLPDLANYTIDIGAIGIFERIQRVWWAWKCFMAQRTGNEVFSWIFLFNSLFRIRFL